MKIRMLLTLVALALAGCVGMASSQPRQLVFGAEVFGAISLEIAGGPAAVPAAAAIVSGSITAAP